MSKPEPQTILKTDERSIHLELGREGQFNRQINRLRLSAALRHSGEIRQVSRGRTTDCGFLDQITR